MKKKRIESNEFVSALHRLQDKKLNDLRLNVNESYKKDEKKVTKFEPFYVEDVSNKLYLDLKIAEVKDHQSGLRKNCNEFRVEKGTHGDQKKSKLC